MISPDDLAYRQLKLAMTLGTPLEELARAAVRSDDGPTLRAIVRLLGERTVTH